MSHDPNTRSTAAMARNVGIRWCSTCQSDRPADGFQKKGCRWICAGYLQNRKARVPSRLYSGSAK